MSELTESEMRIIRRMAAYMQASQNYLAHLTDQSAAARIAVLEDAEFGWLASAAYHAIREKAEA